VKVSITDQSDNSKKTSRSEVSRNYSNSFDLSFRGDSRASALQLMKFEDDEKKINIKRNLTDFDK
jgi:hypothetical protein